MESPHAEEDPKRPLAGAVLAAALLLAWTPARAVTLGQVDDFEDGTVLAWSEGLASPNPPTNQPSGGPAGAADNFLENVSAGGFGAGSQLVMFNQSQWTGDYTAAGVSGIDVQVANFGAVPLHVRVAIQGAGTRYASSTAFMLPADAVWRSTSFSLSAADMTNVGGLTTLASVLAGVDTLRILSASAGPAWNGDAIAATLGVDNIRAVGGSTSPPPVPDGTYGSPLLASRGALTGSVIDLIWDVSTCVAPDYHVIYGSLADVASLGVAGSVCSLGNTGSSSWTTVPAGDLWFLVVSNDGATTEGSWGTDSSGAERNGNGVSGQCGLGVRDNAGTCP